MILAGNYRFNVLPSTMTIKLASSPSRNSSITTRLPALPKALPESISRTASSASCNVIATITPLPAAKPSAFTTIGAPFLAHVCQCRFYFSEVLIFCRWNFVASREIFGKMLLNLQLLQPLELGQNF